MGKAFRISGGGVGGGTKMSSKVRSMIQSSGITSSIDDAVGELRNTSIGNLNSQIADSVAELGGISTDLGLNKLSTDIRSELGSNLNIGSELDKLGIDSEAASITKEISGINLNELKKELGSLKEAGDISDIDTSIPGMKGIIGSSAIKKEDLLGGISSVTSKLDSNEMDIDGFKKDAAKAISDASKDIPEIKKSFKSVDINKITSDLPDVSKSISGIDIPKVDENIITKVLSSISSDEVNSTLDDLDLSALDSIDTGDF